MLTNQQIGLDLGSLETYQTYQDLENAFQKQIDYFIDKIKKYYKKQAFHPSTGTAIVKASLLNDAGIYGAAKLAL